MTKTYNLHTGYSSSTVIEEGDILQIRSGYSYKIVNWSGSPYYFNSTSDDFLYYEYKPGDVVSAPAPIYHKLTDAPVKYSKITNLLPSGNVDIHFKVNGSHPPGLKIKTRADTKVESTEMFAVEIYYDSHKFGNN